LPMICARFLICVAPSAHDGSPELARITAFSCRAGQGINYRRNVWHYPIVALDAPAEFAMLAWEDGTALDCVEWHLAQPVSMLDNVSCNEAGSLRRGAAFDCFNDAAVVRC